MEPYTYKAQLLRVVDGDTIDLCVDLGFNVLTRQRFRIAGIDAPEIYGVSKDSEEYARGQEAKRAVESWFLQIGDTCIIKSQKALKQGKYGRWIADVYNDQGASLSSYLLETGLASTYS
jgi:micrococcal nuclease